METLGIPECPRNDATFVVCGDYSSGRSGAPRPLTATVCVLTVYPNCVSLIQTATKIGGGHGQDDDLVDRSGSWSRRGSKNGASRKADELDQFRVHQQAFYVRGDVIVDLHQARGIRPSSTGDRCVAVIMGG